MSIQVFPSEGRSLLSDTLITGALDLNASLVNGDLTMGSGINIGLVPLGGDTRARHVGLGFSSVTEMNNLLVWINRELPAEIASRFVWEVYVSSDNFNWSLLKAGTIYPFGAFENRFEIDFPNVTTRYIKVVVRPLAPAPPIPPSFTNPENILITEIQAFSKKLAEGAKEETFVSTSQTSNTSLRYRVSDSPLLYYDFSYFYTKNDASDQETSSLSNGLTLNHRLTRILSATARIAREDGTEQDEKRIAYVYNGALTATPLRTLTNSLVFSGRERGSGRRIEGIYLNISEQHRSPL